MKPRPAKIAAFAVLAAAAIPAAPAFAAAWTQPAGQAQVIVNAFHSDSQKGFDTNGDSAVISPYHKTDLTINGEYGVTSRLTGFASTGFEQIDIDNSDHKSGLGYSVLGARYKLTDIDQGVMSFETSVRFPGSTRVAGPAQVGNTDKQLDMRLLVGQSFKIGGWDAFYDAQGGYRLREGAPPNEGHIDLTLGVRPVPRLMLTAQMFATLSNGAGKGVFTDYQYYNGQFGVAYDITPRWTVQAAYLHTLWGQNALMERGFSLSVWRKFGS